MSERDDGGPAFPYTSGNVTAFGMTLRDYFAAKAMHGLLAREGGTPEDYAETAYRQADAMLKARSA